LSKSKLVLYILPAFPALAWYCAAAFKELPESVMRWFRTTGLVFALILLTTVLVFPLFDDAWQQVAPVVILGVMGIALVIYLYRYLPLRESALAIPVTGILMLVAIGGWFLEANEANTSTTKNIAEWIDENDMGERQILVYDQFLPSIDFYTTNQVALIADMRGNVRQDLKFEENSNWESSYYDLEKTEDMARLKTALEQPTVFVRQKGVLSERAGFIVDSYKNNIVFGRWEVFY